MAQLTDDCFAFDGPLMPLEEMERLIAERITPVAEMETVPLAAARGRVLAAELVAPVDLPPFDNSAVDGYAVRHADLNSSGETTLKIAGRLQAGQQAIANVGAGEAVRIFTGAPMPAGADTVFMQEDVQANDATVVVPSGLKIGANRRLAGEDLRRGAVALAVGAVLDPAQIALAAAVGLTELKVRRRINVAVFSTGNEIVEPGSMRSPAAIFDANRYLLAQLLGHMSTNVTDLGILPDDPDRLMRAIGDAGARHDLVITSGGVSTGEADHVRSAVEKIGKLVFWRVAIKPGRPVAMAKLPGHRPGEGAAFVGLPGNPVAVFVTFVRVVRPLLLRLAGARPRALTLLPVRVGFAYKKKTGRREYVRVSLKRHADGELEAIKYPQDGAGVITSLTETDGLLEFGDDVAAVAPGDRAGFLPYAALLG
jgi:molybdopterin molybdotransferase